MIVRPENMDFSGQRFSAILYGSPGIGKTTLACSAPDPVLIDFDHGVSRVRAQHRVPTIISDTYEDVWNDVNGPDMKDFQTVIIDTGGSFVTYLKDWAFRTKPDAKTKSGQPNNLKVFGHVKSEFASFTDYLKNVKNKNVIYVFHSNEQTDKDGYPTQRLLCEGAVRNTVWNSCDFGGYVQMLGNQRTICFTPEQEFFAKGTHGIVGRIPVPELGPEANNDFMTKLFQRAQENIKAENEAFAQVKEQYEQAIAEGTAIIDMISDAESANEAMPEFKSITHALTSSKELGIAWKNKIKSLGLVFDPEAKQYVPAQESPKGES